MSRKNKSNDITDSYSLGLSLMAVAITVFFIPNEYKFSWSNDLAMILLMISSVGFAFSIQKMTSIKDTWDNLGVSLFLFYLIYGVNILLLKVNMLNAITTLFMLLFLLVPFFGLFKRTTNLARYLFNSFKNDKKSFVEVLFKVIPTFLPVISLMLKVFKVI